MLADGAAVADGVLATTGGWAAGDVTLCVLNDSSMTRAATVPTIARMTRRMGKPFVTGGQNSNDSWWIWRRGTPASRSAAMAAVVMPGGPQR